ncbi:hypothetical protein AARAC_011591 [Aspergillus arachidicola]|uniref:TauD/TfdA-like domain-containing protein n=1 Tax=Aspergillus arachidicola TaxID=656916 RepID=A0A2G7G0I6_9EURO|nr:hypothetical protein AARAC_011591 [Aspergillus arachidicola]
MTTTETAITDNAIRTAKIGLGVPSQHTLKSEPDSSDITGTAQYPPALFPNYLPVWEVPQAKYPPIRPFHYIEHGCDADTTFLDLLPPGAKIKDITTALGAEITSVNLEELNDQGKDQLALLAAQKKLLVFRDQKFASMPIGEAVDFCRYFGHLFLHPHSGAPNSHPEIHLVRRRAGNIIAPDFSNIIPILWHGIAITRTKFNPRVSLSYMD